MIHIRWGALLTLPECTVIGEIVLPTKKDVSTLSLPSGAFPRCGQSSSSLGRIACETLDQPPSCERLAGELLLIDCYSVNQGPFLATSAQVPILAFFFGGLARWRQRRLFKRMDVALIDLAPLTLPRLHPATVAPDERAI